MIQIFTKGVRIAVSEHFVSTEFDCKCTRPECRHTAIDDALVANLELLREKASALKINSGFRCNAHNLQVGGAKESRHPMGQAADVRSLIGLTGNDLSLLAESIQELSENAIGTYPDRIHIDTRGIAARWNG